MSGWISVKDKKPDGRKWLLLCVEMVYGREVLFGRGCRVNGDGEAVIKLYGRDHKVTHWMLPPEVPKEE